jgi:uncharacterized protein (TIGR02594 family)
MNMKKLLLTLGLTISLGMTLSSVSAYASPNRDNKVITSREDIRSFQKANGLRVDGIAGAKTKAVMAEKGYSLAVKKKAVANSRTTVAVKVAPAHNPFIKCQFLFWEVECNNPEYENTENTPYDSTQRPTQRTVTRTNSQPNSVASGYNNIYRATKYVGLHEKTNRQKVKTIISKPFDSPIDPVRTPWCAAFANAILRENNYDTTDSLMARSFLTYGVATKRPSKGDIVVLKRGRSSHTGHVGFYVNTVTIDGQTYVAVLGGNQGQAINIAHYPINKVLAYRKPVTAS